MMFADGIDTSWALFLDRDGVINRRIYGGYVQSVDEFHFLPGVLEGLKRLDAQFCRTIIVTNQQGVGKGIMQQSDLEKVHDYMLRTFNQNGIHIDAIYVATNLKGAEIDRRKPSSAMANEAKKDFPSIDFKKSIMVGDTASDIAFGKRLGMKTVWVRTTEEIEIQPDFSINNLNDLADELEK